MPCYIDIHTHIRSDDSRLTEIVNIQPEDPFPGGLCSSGLHPWLIKSSDPRQIFSYIEEKISAGQLAALGECGLDRPGFAKSAPATPDKTQRKGNGLQVQSEIFRKHIELANSANLPVIIHCVRAYAEIIQVRKSFPTTTPWIIHGFRGSAETAAELLRNDIYLSFGKILLHEGRASAKISEVFRQIPTDRIFLETDNLETPSVSITEIYKVGAEIRNVPLSALITQIKENFISAFGKNANFAENTEPTVI